MIDEPHIKHLCDKIEKGQLCDGISAEAHATLAEIERLIGLPAREYTENLRALLRKKRIPDWDRHKLDILGQTMRICGIASMCNQGKAEREAREKRFKVEVDNLLHWPEHGDIRLVARIYENEKYVKSISCVVRDDYINATQIGSKSLSKREARRRKLGQFGDCSTSFQYHIERLQQNGVDVMSIDKIDYEEICPQRYY